MPPQQNTPTSPSPPFNTPPAPPMTPAPAAMPPAPRPRKKWPLIIGGLAVFLVVALVFIGMRSAGTPASDSSDFKGVASTPPEAPQQVQYLTFQLFTDTLDSDALKAALPAASKSVDASVGDMVAAIGATGTAERKLGFVVGPLAFDTPDQEVRQRIRDAFPTALKHDVAVGFHIDDSMFWARLSALNKPENVEWLDWNKTPNTGRRLDWSATPIKIMPQLCFNSPAVVQAVKGRATVVGVEIAQGIELLKHAGKEDLFAGVIAGWETQMGRDFDTSKYLGYCALTNKGYSASKPPAGIDVARADIVREFIDLWTSSLASAGVPAEKMYSHIAFMSKQNFDSQHVAGPYIQQVNFTPPSVAFGPHHHPGFSTYPEIGHLEQLQAEREKNTNPPWASAEGTALDPAQIAFSSGGSMEAYLGDLFNHGATLVNIFGWGVGASDNPFRKVAEGSAAIKAYQKFLSGGTLIEGVLQSTGPSPADLLQQKMAAIQARAPQWVKGNAGREAQLQSLIAELEEAANSGDITTALSVADQIRALIGAK